MALDVSEKYEQRKKAIDAEDANDAEERGTLDTMMAMLGLKAPVPTAAEKITKEELKTYFAEASDATAQPDEEKSENPLIQSIASSWVESSNDPAMAAEALAGKLKAARDYQAGTGWAGVCFAVYNLVAFGFAFLLLGIVKFAKAKTIHLACLICGGVGLVSTVFVSNPNMLLLCMSGVGIAWASILSMPYAMLSNAVPGHKMGFYMGVFNIFIVVPQIIASLGFGPIVKHLFGGDPMKAVTMGGVSFLMAAACTLLVDGRESEQGMVAE